MKKRTLACFGLLGLLVVLGPAAQVVPVAVSPGRAKGVAVVSELCPTFSWTSVDWAVGYRVAVFEALGVGAVSYEQMASGGTEPVLTREIEGRGLSWTPSSEEGLPTGGMYVWYVEAMSPSGPGVWSAGRVFIVDAGAIGTGIEERVTRVLRERGIKDDVITGVLKEMERGGAEGIEGEVESRHQGGVRSQGYDIGDNTFYGLDAGKGITSGLNNSFFGREAGVANSTANCNTFIGWRAGYSNTSGSWNTYIGDIAGFYNSTGAYNTFLGLGAGINKLSGSSNIFIGYYAGGSNSWGNGNIFLGNNAGYFESGSNRLYIANSDTSSPLIYGEFDNGILTVNGKFGVGTKTPTYPMELKTTGRNATFVMQRSDGGAINFVNATPAYGQFGTGNDYPVRILVNSSWRMSLNTDNSLSMVNGATCTAGGVWTNASSRELKENIVDLTAEKAEATLAGLLPVIYSYKVDKAEQHVGFIAEDVPALVASKDRKTVSPMDIVGVLTKVVQEQDKKAKEQQKAILEQQKTMAEQQKTLADYQKSLSGQQKTIEELKARMAELEKKRKLER